MIGFVALLAAAPAIRGGALEGEHVDRLLAIVFFVGALVFASWSASLYARRLHDIGLPGVLAVFPVGVGLLLSAERFAEAWGEREINPFLNPAFFGLAVLSMLVSAMAGFWPGKRLANRYGEPPDRAREDFSLPSRVMFEPGDSAPEARPSDASGRPIAAERPTS